MNTVTPVPCTPVFVRGIVSVRGEIVTLLDLATMIGLRPAPAETGDGPGIPVLLLGLSGMRAGLVVDEVLGVERIKLGSVQTAPSGREFVRGIGPSDTVLLDLEALFASSGLAFETLEAVEMQGRVERGWATAGAFRTATYARLVAAAR